MRSELSKFYLSEYSILLNEHNRHNGRNKSGCNAGWAYLGMLAKIKL